jgi:hypothetical protein
MFDGSAKPKNTVKVFEYLPESATFWLHMEQSVQKQCSRDKSAQSRHCSLPSRKWLQDLHPLEW